MSSQQTRTKKHQIKLEETQVQNQEKEVGLHICNSAAEPSGSGIHQQLTLVQGALDKFKELESIKSY